MKLLKTLKGFRPLTFIPDGILLARGYDIFRADLECAQLTRLATIPRPVAKKVAYRLRLLARILRLGVRFGTRISEYRYLLAEGRRLWVLDLSTGQVTLDHVVERGSRPLCVSAVEGVAGFDSCMCYGEYWENAPKDAVRIWIRDSDGAWRVAYTFPEGTIEHVHAIVPDRDRGLLWILTGDFGDSAGIWVARDGFKEVSPALVGKQQFRCCWLGQLGQRIVYATDSPLEPNSLRELVVFGEPSISGAAGFTARSEHLLDISGSSIYACTVRDQLVFSTTVEPGLLTGRRVRDLLDRSIGPGIEGPYADLMMGDESRGFARAGRWPKDKWPSRLCEFGSITFPTGFNPGNRLYAYFTALAAVDGSMCIFEAG